MDRARALALEGERLMENKHYAVDSILPKCQELHHLCNHFASEVSRRRGQLSKSLELHGLLEEVWRPAHGNPAPTCNGPAAPMMVPPLVPGSPTSSSSACSHSGPAPACRGSTHPLYSAGTGPDATLGGSPELTDPPTNVQGLE